MSYKIELSLAFTITLCMLAIPVSAAYAEPGEIVRCESRHGNYTRCESHTRGKAELDHKISNASCRRGKSWGYEDGAIWVDNGCRGFFKIVSRDDDYWGHDDKVDNKARHGRCKLVDRDRGSVIFTQGCRMKQNSSSRVDKYVLKMDSGRKFVFKDTGDGYYISSREGGTVKARHRSEGRSKNIFVWNNWRLVYENRN